MPPRRRVPKRRNVALTLAQIVELSIGPNSLRESEFDSEADRRAAWEAHRPRLIAHVRESDELPWAWCEFVGDKLPRGVRRSREPDFADEGSHHGAM